jgi:hypothetical protein
LRKVLLMEEKLVQTLKSFDYRQNRYKIDYSVAIWYSPKEIDFHLLSNRIRSSDRLVSLDNHHYVIIFDYTSAESGIQAVNNFLEHYKSTFLSEPLFYCVANSSQFESIHIMVPELLIQLNQTIENNQMAICDEL